MRSKKPHKVHVVKYKEQLDGIIDVVWAAMDGVDASHQIFYPVLTNGPDSRQIAIAMSKERKWEEHIHNPNSHWIYVTKDGTSAGDIIAGCEWRIYTENPFPKDTFIMPEATWWPPGEGRDFANEVVKQCYTPRTTWMARPHTGVSDICVLPAFQRQGVGTALIQWGVERSDALELESFIEGTPPGKALYTSCGYKLLKEVNVNMAAARKGRGELWKLLEKDTLPIGYTATWRPKGGITRDGEYEKTWAEWLDEKDVLDL